MLLRPNHLVIARATLIALVLCSLSDCASPAINVAERIDVGDAKLYVEVRGADRRAPLMVWLHGGPGGAERPLFRYFNSDLERHLLVTYLDQRGAGLSYDSDAPTDRLTIAQHVADLDRVINHLLREFRRDQVVLVGHSWGTVLGTLYVQAHPEKVAGLINVAPVVSIAEQQRREYAFDLAEAQRLNDVAAIAELREIGSPPYPTPERVLRLERLTDHYHGVQFRDQSRWLVASCAVLQGIVTPWEIVRIIQGNEATLAAMHQELSNVDIRTRVETLDVPVFFFLGRHDRHVDSNLARTYFSSLRAPHKELIWFEQSAHDVPFDEPDAFNAELIRAVQSINAPR